MKRVMMILMLLGVLSLGGYQIVFAEPPLENCTTLACNQPPYCNRPCHCVSLNMDLNCSVCPESGNCY
jgi:hypothetical protein